jgi:SET domain-containing protein
MATRTPARPYVVRVSPIHGRGVFAARAIRKGARIVEYRGQRISWKEAEARPPSDPANPFHTFYFTLEDGRVIDAGVRGNAARWINHSCQPNCESEESDDGRVYIRARRAIRAGEERSYDYRLTIDGRLTKAEREAFRCRCGAPRCRGTLLVRKP